jgi:hypothetical protein
MPYNAAHVFLSSLAAIAELGTLLTRARRSLNFLRAQMTASEANNCKFRKH